MYPINTINFTQIEKKNNQYNIVNLYSENERIYLNLPKLHCPFGITKYVNNGIEKYSLNVSLTEEESPKIFKFIENIDDLVTDNFLENKSWLDTLEKPIDSTRKDIEQLGNKLINKQENFPPYLNLKLIYDNKNQFYCNILKCDKLGKCTQLRTIEDIKSILYKKMFVKSQIIVSNVWIMKDKYGITLKPKKIVFYE